MVCVGLALAGAMMLRYARRYTFKDKVVVIAGASRGLGLAMARQLEDEGAIVVSLARSPEDLRNAEDQVAAHGKRVLSIPCDICVQAEVEAAIALTIERFSRVDVLINNAGVIQVGPFDHLAISDFDEAIATHMYGPLFTMMEVLPHMRRQGQGRIVNIASICGKVAMPHMAAYCASKFALVGLSDALRGEFARENIKVTTVCPWFMRTGSVFNVNVKGRHEEEFAWFASGASIPVLSIHVERAARKILEACRRGSPRLLMGVWSKAAVLANELTPGLMAKLQDVANRLLPRPKLVDGDFPRTGWQSQSKLTPQPLLNVSRKAALRNNEVRHAIRASTQGA